MGQRPSGAATQGGHSSGVPQVPSLKRDLSTPSPNHLSSKAPPRSTLPPHTHLFSHPLLQILWTPDSSQTLAGVSPKKRLPTPGLISHSRGSLRLSAAGKCAQDQDHRPLQALPQPPDPPAPGPSYPSSHFPTPLTGFWPLDLVPKSPSSKVAPSLVSPKHPRGPPPRPPTWRRVVQLAVIGPPAGARRLPNKERARHGGRSSWGSPSRAVVAKPSTREAAPLRCE